VPCPATKNPDLIADRAAIDPAAIDVGHAATTLDRIAMIAMIAAMIGRRAGLTATTVGPAVMIGRRAGLTATTAGPAATTDDPAVMIGRRAGLIATTAGPAPTFAPTRNVALTT